MQKRRILIVEDEAIVARDLSHQLSELGYEPVAQTTTGEEALVMAEQLRPDLVLMDVHLAGSLDGIATAQMIRERFSIPAVFLTAYIEDAILDRAKAAQPYGYLTKPFQSIELRMVIDVALIRHQAETQISRMYEEHAAVLRTAMDGFWIVDAQGRLLDVNDAYCRMIGYTREELLRMSIADMDADKSPDQIASNINRIKETGCARFERRHRHKDGSIIDVEASVNYLPTSGGRFFCFLRDITERKRFEEVQAFLAQRSSGTVDEPFFNALARYLAQSLGMDFVCIDRLEGDGLNARTVAVWCDGHFEDNVTYALKDTPCGDVVGKTVCCFPASVTKYFPRDQVLQDLRAESYIGVTLWSHTGKPIGLIAVIGRVSMANRSLAEVTLKLVAVRAAGELERLDAEQSLRETQTILQAAMDNSPVGIAIADAPSGTLRYVNDEGLLIRGGDRKNIVNGIGIDQYVARWQLLDFDGRPLKSEEVPLVRAIMFGETCRREFIIRRTNDDDRFVLANASPIKDDNGKVVAGIVVFMDITERKHAEDSLRESGQRAQRQRSLFEAVTVHDTIGKGDIDATKRILAELASRALQVERASVWLLSADGNKLECIELFEFSLGKHTQGYVLQAGDYPRYFDAIRTQSRIAAGDARIDLRTSEFAQGYLIPLGIASMLDAVLFLEGGVAGVVCFEHTGEKREWHPDEESFATAIASLMTQAITNASRKRAENALRESEERLRRAVLCAPLPIMIHAEDGEVILISDAWTEITGYSHAEIPSIADWTERACGHRKELVRRDIDRLYGLEEKIKEGEYVIRTKSGSLSIWDFMSASLGQLPDGRRMAISMAMDITERKRTEVEKQKLEAQNSQLQKSESLGRMAGAIAHHFNNHLMAVMMNLEMATRGQTAGEVPTENLIGAMHSARKAAEVSSLMLTYLGQKQCILEPLDLSDACHQSLPMLRAAIPKDVVLDVDLPTPGPSIQANASQIQQVLTHLATNAWESSGGGQAVIRLAVKTVAATDISAVNRFPIDWQQQDSAYACLEVADTGSGIPLQDIQKLFEPFFSSKFTGRGLGLPVVLGIVRAHHGVVTVESKPGCGSVFRVFLPLSVEAVSQNPVPVAQAPKLMGGGTVLVVDDETSVREVLKTVIEVIGFTVLAAKDGVEAVEVFRQHQDEIRLVLCDLTMPRMDGWETLSALRKLAPDIPVILSSGYSEAHVMEGNHPELPQAFLSKPCRLVELREAFALVLNRVDR